MKRLLATVGLVAGLVVALVAVLGAAGHAGRPTTACDPVPGLVTLCINSRPLEFAEGERPHWHGNRLYAPVEPLGRKLGVEVRARLFADGESALLYVNRKAFAPAMAHDALGVHAHDGVVFVPLREFALAVGLDLEIDAKTGTAGLGRK